MKVVRAENAQAARVWAEVLVRPGWLQRTTNLKEEGSSWVRRGWVELPAGEREVVVKCRAIMRPAERVKCWLRQGRGDRHWRGAAWLEQYGLRTAHTLALARGVVDGRLCELLVMEALPGKTVLQHLSDRDLTVREEHAVARELGWIVRRFRGAGRFNRDHKPSNLLVTRVTESEAEVAIIDCVGLRKGSERRSPRMFASMVIEPIGCGLPPRRTLMMRALQASGEACTDGGRPDGPRQGRRRSSHRSWNATRKVVEAHVDRRPRVNPLSSYTPAPSTREPER